MSDAHGANTVEVLLATYNGEPFLREQIDSILGQSYPNLRVLARDDGSTDRTVAILDEYARSEPRRFQLLSSGPPTGSAKGNFAALMRAATADYICFADQDDVWLPDKVGLMVEHMLRLEARYGRETPSLIFTDLEVVDEHLAVIRGSMWKAGDIEPRNIHRIERLLGQNVVTGCTSMINRALLEVAAPIPEEATMHDRWIGLLACALGRAEPVPQATVLYRQHDRNVIGASVPDDSVSGLVRRAGHSQARRLERWRSEQQTAALLRLHGNRMTAAKREVLEAYLQSGRSSSRLVRVGATLRYGFWRKGLLRNLVTIVDLWRADSSQDL